MEVLLELISSEKNVHQGMICYLRPVGHKLFELVPLTVFQRRYALHLRRISAVSPPSQSRIELLATRPHMRWKCPTNNGRRTTRQVTKTGAPRMQSPAKHVQGETTPGFSHLVSSR